MLQGATMTRDKAQVREVMFEMSRVYDAIELRSQDDVNHEEGRSDLGRLGCALVLVPSNMSYRSCTFDSDSDVSSRLRCTRIRIYRRVPLGPDWKRKQTKTE